MNCKKGDIVKITKGNLKDKVGTIVERSENICLIQLGDERVFTTHIKNINSSQRSLYNFLLEKISKLYDFIQGLIKKIE